MVASSFLQVWSIEKVTCILNIYSRFLTHKRRYDIFIREELKSKGDEKMKTMKKPKRKITSLRQRAFLAGRDAALKAGWAPFTKMSKKQKLAFREAYNKTVTK